MQHVGREVLEGLAHLIEGHRVVEALTFQSSVGVSQLRVAHLQFRARARDVVAQRLRALEREGQRARHAQDQTYDDTEGCNHSIPFDLTTPP